MGDPGEKREREYKIFEEIMAGNFPDLMKSNLQIQEAQQIPSRKTQNVPLIDIGSIVKLLKAKGKEKS